MIFKNIYKESSSNKNVMLKRGQVTIFVILGLVIIIIIAIAIFGRNLLVKEDKGDEGNIEKVLQVQMSEIEKRINKCVDEKVGEKINILGEQGGYFDPVDYLYYYGDKITFLCKKIDPDENCVNSLLIKEDLSLRLEQTLGDSISRCLDFTDLMNNDDFTFYFGDMLVSTRINYDNILVTVDYPISLTQKNVKVEKNLFVKEVKVPLGDMINVANDILSSEAVAGDFETLGYTLLHSSRYNIEKRNPYPDRVYIIRVLNNPYIFQFAIQGGSNG